MVMGIMGKTQGVKMQASPRPKATSRKAPQPWEAGGGTAAEEDGGGWCGGSRIDDDPSRAGPLAGYATGVVAGLVADLDGKRSGAGGGVDGKSNIEQEGFLAFVGFGFGVEGGVEGAFGSGLEHAHQSAGGNLESGGDTGGGRSRVEMPAGIDLGGGADPDA